jgi:hypothetical protein
MTKMSQSVRSLTTNSGTFAKACLAAASSCFRRLFNQAACTGKQVLDKKTGQLRHINIGSRLRTQYQNIIFPNPGEKNHKVGNSPSRLVGYHVHIVRIGFCLKQRIKPSLIGVSRIGQPPISGRGENTRKAPSYRIIPLKVANSACGMSQDAPANRLSRFRLSRLLNFNCTWI